SRALDGGDLGERGGQAGCGTRHRGGGPIEGGGRDGGGALVGRELGVASGEHGDRPDSGEPGDDEPGDSRDAINRPPVPADGIESRPGDERRAALAHALEIGQELRGGRVAAGPLAREALAQYEREAAREVGREL